VTQLGVVVLAAADVRAVGVGEARRMRISEAIRSHGLFSKVGLRGHVSLL